MSLFVIASSVAPAFYRLGRRWTREGVLVNAAEFARDEWDRLRSEARLIIREATEEEIRAAADNEALAAGAARVAIAEAIRALGRDDFQKDGKPRLDALRAALPEGVKLTADLRDAVWKELRAEGFTAPEA